MGLLQESCAECMAHIRYLTLPVNRLSGVQVPHLLGSVSKTWGEEGAEQDDQKEHREAGRRFRQAHVNVRLAQQWAGGQPWAKLDIMGVPWSQEAAAAAQCIWLRVRHTF